MSSSVLEIVAPADAHLIELAQTMRLADRAELAALGFADPLPVLRSSLKHSTLAACALIDGKVWAVGGAVPFSLLSESAAPWMLGSTLIDRSPRHLIARGPSYIHAMLNKYPHLVNYVHARNVRAIRWLKWLGFELHAATPYGLKGEPFHRFEMRA